MADKDSLDVTASSTTLCLMRTIKDNYKKGCGHFFMAVEENDYVAIMGCPSGIDRTIIHTDDGKI